MKTLRQEIENLIEEIKSSTKIKSENIQWDNGFDVCANSIKKDLTDILSSHTEPEQTAPSQRERIATACMQGMLADSLQSGRMAEYAKRPVTAADALIEELNKNEKSKELNSSDTKSRFDSDLFISNVCSSYRHDFGLMTEDDQQKLRFECKEWMRAIQNNWDHFKY